MARRKTKADLEAAARDRAMKQADAWIAFYERRGATGEDDVVGMATEFLNRPAPAPRRDRTGTFLWGFAGVLVLLLVGMSQVRAQSKKPEVEPWPESAPGVTVYPAPGEVGREAYNRALAREKAARAKEAARTKAEALEAKRPCPPANRISSWDAVSGTTKIKCLKLRPPTDTSRPMRVKADTWAATSPASFTVALAIEKDDPKSIPVLMQARPQDLVDLLGKTRTFLLGKTSDGVCIVAGPGVPGFEQLWVSCSKLEVDRCLGTSCAPPASTAAPTVEEIEGNGTVVP